MLSNEALLAKWNSHNGGYVRIDAVHPLEWNIGYESINQRCLLLITDYEPYTVPSSKSIVVSSAQRLDKKWALSFRLIRNEQEDVFIRLCCDLIVSSRHQIDSIQALEFVLNRYRQWSRLMELQRNGILSESERKGLLGEITYIQKLIATGVAPPDAINSWIGAEGADQDFFDAKGWHEIKAPGIATLTITISSLEQLDAQLPGELVVFFIDQTASNSAAGFTLNSKVNQLRESLKGHESAFELFNQKLLRYGYLDLPDYDQHWYRLGGSQTYRVDETFPRLTRANVHSAIAAASYQLSLQAIANWRVE